MNRIQQITQHLSPTNTQQSHSNSPCNTTSSSSTCTSPCSASSSSSSNNDPVVVVGMARTPLCGLAGQLSSLSASELGAVAIRAALSRSNVPISAVEELFFGCVLTAAQGQAPARQAAIKAGLSVNTPCTTINKVCASGMKAFTLGVDTIRAGTRSCIVVGGMESMSQTPYYVMGTRTSAFRLGHETVKDGIVMDGLTDAYDHCHMGTAAEICATNMNITRQQQDEYATESYRRAKEAQKNNSFDPEIVPVEVKLKGKKVLVRVDEEPSRGDPSRFSSLKPAFPTSLPSSPSPARAGSVTAANASVISDGACALVIMSLSRATALGIKPLAVVEAHSDAALKPLDYCVAPAVAIPQAIKKAGIEQKDVDFYEINEAFSAVAIANMRLLNIAPSQINVFGGAVALGHPIGCSGARILITLINVLQQKNGKVGVAAICNGGGGATAVVIRKA